MAIHRISILRLTMIFSKGDQRPGLGPGDAVHVGGDAARQRLEAAEAPLEEGILSEGFDGWMFHCERLNQEKMIRLIVAC